MRTLSLLTLALVATVHAELSSSVENTICIFVVGKIESDVSCTAIASDVTTLAADLLNGTTFEKWTDNELVIAAAKFICDEAVTWVKEQGDGSPAGICADLENDLRRRSRRAVSPGPTMDDVRGNWTNLTTQRFNILQARKMAPAGTPVSVDSQGNVGYCYQAAPMYHCMEPGYPTADAYAASTPAGRRVTSMQAVVSSGSGSSGVSKAVLEAGVAVLGISLIIVIAYAVVLTRSLKTANSAQVVHEDDGNTLLMADE